MALRVAATARALLALALLAAPARARVGETIGPSIFRFHASESARAAALPSIALQHPFPALGPLPGGDSVRVHPVFTRIGERFGVRVDAGPGVDWYGTGEVAGPLRRNGRAVTLWNLDAYGWGEDSQQLYQSHPWVLGVRPDGSALGLLFDTTYRSRIELGDRVVFFADGPACPVIVIERGTPGDVVEALADLTGHMPLPPLWALGYQQCRYSYTPDSRVREIAREFRRRRLPCDVIWMDIDYMDGYRSFTFHPERFPDPGALSADLHRQGFHGVWMIDPGIKREPGYSVYDSGRERDVWVRAQDGSLYTGDVWPGECVFPDFTRPDVRAWWASLYGPFLARGVDGVWNDMNEPAVFDVGSKTMPVRNRHGGDPAFGGPADHARYHNVYGMLMSRATREGMRAARPEQRPFVLTRASHLGGQRYAATWTGDNSANEYHLRASIPMVLNLGLSGQPFAGPDIGGFRGNGSAELFARWIAVGALLPFARAHTEKGSVNKEPWAFGAAVESTARLALERRYRLMPYLYTVFREAAETGLPVARPLFFADPQDPRLRAVDDAFLLGGDVLVRARWSPAGGAAGPLPAGGWRGFVLDAAESADRTLPDLYLRPGAILPVGPVEQHTGARPLEPLILIVRLDAAGRAEGALYEDAGDGYGYERGAYRVSRFTAVRTGDTVRIEGRVAAGSWPWKERATVVRVLLDGREVTRTTRGGRTIEIPLGRTPAFAH